MNIVTYKRLIGDKKGLDTQMVESVERCTTYEQVISMVDFYMGYIKALVHFESIKYRPVTDNMINSYFKNQNKLKASL